MAMLHPRFNHLGRSKKRKPKPVSEEHARFLRKHGIDPDRKRIRLRGAVQLDNAANNPRYPDLPLLSDGIDGPAYKRREDQ